MNARACKVYLVKVSLVLAVVVVVVNVIVNVIVVASFAASAANSAHDMLAAGRIDDAIAALHARIASAPTDAEASNLLCRAYYALEDWKRAESSCGKAVVLAPGNGRFHLWLGRVYGEKADRAGYMAAAGLAGKVREEFERAVQLDPKDMDARENLTEFYIEAPGIMGGGERKARQQAQFMAALNPAREHWVYARIAEKKKDAATAEREYRQSIALSKGDAEAWLDWAFFLRRQKRFDEMEQALVKLSQAPMPKLDVLMEAAQILYGTGRSYPFATDLLRRYLAAGPVEAAPAFRAHYLLGVLLEKQGDRAGAAREYRASLSLAREFGMAQQALNRVTH
jgi:Tfp pilus assembly protein PilF